MRGTARLTIGGCLLLAVGLAGCGGYFGDVFYQTVDAAGRTLLDQLITDTVNGIADAFDAADDNQNDNASSDGSSQNDNTGGGSGDNQNDNAGGSDDLVGDAARGLALYMGSCMTCHCPDAVGGCLFSAPGLINASADSLSDFVRGDANHPVKREWTNQDVVDVETYLAGLGN
jgi:mono/diheme cytochrome c family protein